MPGRLWLLVLLLLGCDRSAFAAHGAGRMIARGSGAVQEHWDYEFAKEAIPAAILRLEGIHEVVPDDELVMLQLVRAYSAYGFAFLEEDMELAEQAGDYEVSDRESARALQVYERALRVAKRLLRSIDDGFDDALRGGARPFRAWVDATFDSSEDAEVLFWCAYAWSLYIRRGTEDPSVVIDLPFARALAERSVALDPEYFNAGALTLLATMDASVGPELGGNPDRARQNFERALRLTHRHALTVQLNFAQTYAVMTQRRELFERLLEEVIDSGDVLPEARFANKVAQRRAARLLRRTSELFE